MRNACRDAHMQKEVTRYEYKSLKVNPEHKIDGSDA